MRKSNKEITKQLWLHVREDNALYSASVDDLDIICCFLNFQHMSKEPRIT